jgi:serine/threonine protein kinase
MFGMYVLVISKTYKRAFTNAKLIIAHLDIDAYSRKKMDTVASLLERYYIENLIETGSTARVMKAVRSLDGKVFAMKVAKTVNTITSIPEEILINQELMAADIKGVTQMHEYAIDFEMNRYVIIMEYMPMDLHTYVSRRATPITEEECCHIICQVVKILLDMQNMVGMQHMDLKMENVLIDPLTKEVKLCDFGHIAKVEHLWTDSKSKGTHLYWAPETVKERRFYPTRSIVWQVGLLAYDIIQEVPWEMYKDGNLSDLTFERFTCGKAISFIYICLEPDVRIRVDLYRLLQTSWLDEKNNNEMICS